MAEERGGSRPAADAEWIRRPTFRNPVFVGLISWNSKLPPSVLPASRNKVHILNWALLFGPSWDGGGIEKGILEVYDLRSPL